MERAQKSELVTSLNEVFNSTGVVIVAHYKGLTVAEMSQYRAEMRKAGASVKVAKNRLVKIALQGTAQESITDLFTGPTLLSYSDDPVAAPKVATEFAKKNQKLVILGGALGSQALDPDGVKALAELPSLDELRGKILGMLATPATRIAQVVNAPAGQVARVLSAYAEKDNAA